MNIPKKLQPFIKEWPLALLLLAGFLLRLKGLTHQSMWVDELHTMNEADPAIGWGDMCNYLKCCDQHPPFFFAVERLAFMMAGHTEFVARLITVLAGTVSIWAMYLLGKEMLNRSLGLIIATLTCVNYYSISYSQEARPYIFAFLFAALSFTWFARLVRSPSRKNLLLYSLFTLLLLYSHYYSLFVVAAQGALALLFIFQEKGPARTDLFKKFFLSGIIMGIAYAPWIPFLKAMAAIKSFWIHDISPSFLQDFFYDYFGNADLLKPLLLLLLFVYVSRVSLQTEAIKGIKNNPLVFGFIITLFWVFVSLLIPYIRSALTVPMLFPRYSIVILPAILLSLGWGIELFKTTLLKCILTGLFVILSLVHLIIVNKYYTAITKTQFREVTRFITDNNKAGYPILNDLTAWQQGYYLKRYGSKAPVIAIPKEKAIDSILTDNVTKNVTNGFWIVGTSGSNKPDPARLHRLDSAYILVLQKDFYDAWARLYVSPKVAAGTGYTFIKYDQFKGGTLLPENETVAIWNGAISSGPVPLPKNNYTLVIRARGDPGENQFPHLNIYANGKKLGDYYLTADWEDKTFNFETTSEEPVVFKLEMDNDFFAPGKGDRNVFVRHILIQRR